MAERLTVHDEEGKKIYDISINNSFDTLKDELEKFNTRKRRVCIITESNVEKYYGKQVLDIVQEVSKEAYLFSFKAGEENKNLNTVQDVYKFLIENKFDRKDLLIALGGGVTGDLTGFAAATYLRGIDFIQVPTTLLAQSDSSVGGKTGVDFECYKNMVGAFYQPKLVYINTETLKTLSRKEFLSGMGEVVKHGIIKDKNFYLWLKNNSEKIKELDSDTLEYMTKMNCSIKRNVVENDFKESGERALLNLGHTLGHAIEKFVFKERLHGECVSLGIVGAAYISLRKKFISKEEYEDILSTLQMFELPIQENNIDMDDVIDATFNDKKMEAGKIKFILINEIGKAEINTTVDVFAMKDAVSVILAGGKYEY